MSQGPQKKLKNLVLAALLALFSNQATASFSLPDLGDGSLTNPFMPNGFIFGPTFSSSYNFTPTSEFIYIDPDVATGYTYSIYSGPNFSQVILPTNGQAGGQTSFNLHFGSNNFQLSTGTAFDFTAYETAGVSSFVIDGINTSAALDPTKTDVFVTGLKFVSNSPVIVTQIPIVTSVPEPSLLALFGIGMLWLGILRTRKAV